MSSKPSTPESDGPKTETTLTTRIRINIPGSRPIPPVVVRKAMGDGPGAANAEPEARPAPRQQAPAPAPQPPAPAAPSAPTGSGVAYGPGRPAGTVAAPGPKQPLPTRIQAEPEPPAGPGRPAGAEEPASNWFAPRKPPAPGPVAGQGPGPGQGSGPGPGPVPTPPGPPVGGGFAPPARTPGPPSGDFGQGFAQPSAPAPAPGPAPAPPAPGGPGAGAPQGYPAYGSGHADPGPVTEAFPVYGTPPGGTRVGPPGGPAGPTGGPGMGSTGPGPFGAPPAGEGPRWPGPEADGPVPGRAPAAGPAPVPVPAPAPAPAAPRPAPAQQKSAAKPAKKKGRSKVVLLGGGLVALLGLAYGAGLLLNHSDVPKGTTVLGVDISGSRDEAVSKLQTSFGSRAAAPLQLTVGGKQVELKPDKAGLSLDSQTTVRNAAGSDYNPITVIGSLLGNQRKAEPVLPVDEEKLQVALQELAGASGTVTEGTITFDTGKAVAVPGKPGSALDAGASVEKVSQAFRDMVATGKAAPVELPVTTRNPVIDQAELDRAMKEFAEPAMSAKAVVKIGSRSLPFGSKSLPTFLSMQPVDGHLVEKFDLDALKESYGNTFDGILIARGNGEKTAVMPQDVAGALGKALRGKTTAERTVTIDTNPA